MGDGETPPAGMPARARWGGASAPASAVGLIGREAAWVAVVAQAVWVLATPALRPASDSVALTVAFVLVVLGWVVLVLAQVRGGARARRWVAWIDVGAVAVAAFVVGATAVVPWGSGVPSGWDPAASLVILCGLLIGSLVDVRAGAVALVLLVMLAIEPSVRLATDALPGVAVPLYTLVIGGALVAVRYRLEGNAARIDADIHRRDEIERQQQTVEGVEAALRRQERLLHETVLNTLTAIHRGGLSREPGMADALHGRCREAVDVLTGLEDGAQALGPSLTIYPSGYVGLGGDLLAFIDGLRADGLDVEVVTDSLEDVPDRVAGALVTAVREALANVARHAQAQHAWLLVRVHRASGLSVRVEVRDDGTGFDTRTAGGRFGLRRAIAGPLEEVGGQATVDSRPGHGTRVVLEWRRRSGDAIDRHAQVSGGFALPPVATLGLFLAATAALAWLQFDHPPLTLSDAAMVVVLGILIALATPEAPLPWPLIVAVGVLAPLFALLDASGMASSTFGGGWALAAIAAMFMAAAAIGPPWSWVVLLASWLTVELDRIDAVLQPATLVVVAGAAFGRVLRRDTAALERGHRQRASAETALEVTREGLRRLRARYGPLEDSEAIALLAGIADGTLDPEDPDVRARAGLEEVFIRTLVRIDPETDPLRAWVTELSRAAHGRQVALKADLALPAVPAVVVPDPVVQSFRRAVESAVPNGSARLMARSEGDAVVVTLLAPILDGEQDAMRALPVPGYVTDPDDPRDTSMLWEAHLGAGGPW